MSTIGLFLQGAREFRSDLTTHHEYPEIETYDQGREWAHRLTLRLFESDPAYREMPWRRRLTLRGL